MMTNQQIWQAALGELELVISRASFTTWFKNTYISSIENNKIVICVPNAFTKTWLEKKYNKAILKAVQNITQERIKEIIYKVENIKAIPKEIPQTAPETNQEPENIAVTETIRGVDKSGLNRRYTFQNFIVGKSNELANAACLAVAKQPGMVYNPLFIYGGVGLGKTHLLQAVGNEILIKHNRRKVLYVSAETFTNEYIQAVKRGYAKEFKDRYRSVDVLLIDDIQFISGKEGTQEEFFHTFNTLHQDNRQIVITSDRPPKAIESLSSRLLSRFEWGMIADIGTPDLETRIAILEAKCKEKKYQLNDELLQFIAKEVSNNIRELEGVLNRIIAYHQINKLEPRKEDVKNIIRSITSPQLKNNITPKQLLAAVAEYFDISINDLLSKSREKKITYPRQIVMYLLRKEINFSFPAIGQELGGRDHTTAIHAYTKISKELLEDEKLRQDIELLKQKLYKNQ